MQLSVYQKGVLDFALNEQDNGVVQDNPTIVLIFFHQLLLINS